MGSEVEVAKFLLRSTYTAEGVRGMIKDGGTKRVEVIRKAIEANGGRLESVHFSFGKHDTYVVCELPDYKSAAGLAIAVRATGTVDSQITPLLTAAEVDEMTRGELSYQAPGR